jgi:polyhydroxybutyrate depolymerase
METMETPMRNVLLALPWLVLAQAALAQRPSLPELTAAAADTVRSLDLGGAGFAAVLRGRVVHQSVHGAFAADQVEPIDAASTWLAVATVMSLADEGQLDLDVSVGRYLSEFDHPEKRRITLRQCLACLAGLHPRVSGLERAESMADVARILADAPVRSDLGTEFVHGGVTFQVAACAAERVSGKSWHELFRTRIAGPLGMKRTTFGRMQPPGAEAGSTPVPWVWGGAVSTLEDYARFVAMLANGGEFEGVRVLSRKSVGDMFADQDRSRRLRVSSELFGSRDVRYGLGTWIEYWDEHGRAQRGSDPGAFGWTGWVDPDAGVGGVFAVRHRAEPVLRELPHLQDLVRELLTETGRGADHEITLDHGGRKRSYLLHVPPQAELAQRVGDKLPLVLVLHGGGGNGQQAAESTGFSALADREGFVVAYPDGTGRLPRRLLTWNSGGIPVWAVEHDIDDVGFLKAVVRDVQGRLPIDADRVHATGISNGGMMVHRLAREAADVFAAVAPVSGAMNFTAADSAQPISVLIVHGTADRHVRYGGGEPLRATGRAGERTDASVADAARYYVLRNGLADEPRTETEGKVKTETWDRTASGTPARARVQVVTLDGGGHAWPGGRRARHLGADAPFDWPASERIWEFFAQARRQPAPGAPAAGPGRGR